MIVPLDIPGSSKTTISPAMAGKTIRTDHNKAAEHKDNTM
jgi:hypothetical protein